MRKLAATLVACASLCGGVGVAAADDWKTCYAESGDVAIAACTRAIQSGKYKSKDLATLYVNRGAEWDNKKEYDKELADLSDAIRYDAKQPAIYKNRATVFRFRGETERALADYTTAIGLDPLYTAAYVNRGLLYEEDKNDRERAKADYRAALAVPPKFSDGAWAHTTARAHLDKLEGK
jgi:tetratricopeptide (TPR) repeat protein